MLLMLGVNPGVIRGVHLKFPVSNPKNSALRTSQTGPRAIPWLRQDALVSISSWWSQICAGTLGNLQLKMPVVGMYFPKTIKAAYIYIDTCTYIERNRGAKATYIYIIIYSSSILSWVNNHQALFKPQGGVSKPSCAHRHVGPSNPYVKKIRCLFIYLFQGFFLMGTSITIRREMSSRVFFCAKKIRPEAADVPTSDWTPENQ